MLDHVRKMRRAASRGVSKPPADPGGLPPDTPVSPELDRTLDSVKRYLDSTSGLKARHLNVAGRASAILYIEQIVDKPRLESGLILPLQQAHGCHTPDSVLQEIVPSTSGREVHTIHDIVWAILDGDSILVCEGWPRALAFDIRGGDKRPISEPEMEVTIKGPRQSFVEDVNTNLAMIRRKIRHPSLRLMSLTIGNLSRTKVFMLYIQGIARPDVVAEVFSRLSRIDIDAVEDTGYLVEFIEDSPMSPFPQVGVSERPDRVTAGLSQGRVAVLVDGSPFAMMVPFPAVAFLQSPDDSYERWPLTLITRVTRLASVLISIFFPAFYVALTTFHQEIIPRHLALTIAVQREQVPYPVLVECFALIAVFEIVTEASVRLPRAMGQTIGIVGTLVIGESAVRANLTSNVTVIVIATTAVAQFTVPPGFTTTIRLLRLPLLVLGSSLGLYGVFAGTILILLHVASLRCVGLPYLYPYSPLSTEDLGDASIRLPWWTHTKRPVITAEANVVRIRRGKLRNRRKTRVACWNSKREDSLQDGRRTNRHGGELQSDVRLPGEREAAPPCRGCGNTGRVSPLLWMLGPHRDQRSEHHRSTRR
ncbi:MAG: spore germination protein [Bacillota bacterium]